MKHAGLECCFPVEPAEPRNLIKQRAIEVKFHGISGFPCFLQTDGCEV